MSPELIIALITFIYSVIYSVKKQHTISKRLESYKKLVTFSKTAKENLNLNFENISNIASNSFNLPLPAENTYTLWESLGFRNDDIEKIMEYTVRYNQLDLNSLQTESDVFHDYAVQAYQKEEKEQQKSASRLLCPPVLALVVLILVI